MEQPIPSIGFRGHLGPRNLDLLATIPVSAACGVQQV
jgi:hypothetical protein